MHAKTHRSHLFNGEGMQLLAATGGLANTNGYVIVDDENKVAVAIDAPQDTMRAGC